METMSFHSSTAIGDLSGGFLGSQYPVFVVVGATAWGAVLGAIVSGKGARGRGALVGAGVNGGAALALAIFKAATTHGST